MIEGKIGRRVFAILAFALASMAPADAAAIKSLDIGKGREVWFAEDHTVPIVAAVFSFPAGSAYDPADKAGLATFAASLMDEGAGGLNSSAFHQALAGRANFEMARYAEAVDHYARALRAEPARIDQVF